MSHDHHRPPSDTRGKAHEPRYRLFQYPILEAQQKHPKSVAHWLRLITTLESRCQFVGGGGSFEDYWRFPVKGDRKVKTKLFFDSNICTNLEFEH